MRKLGLDLAPRRGKASQFLTWKQTSLRPLLDYYITVPYTVQGNFNVFRAQLPSGNRGKRQRNSIDDP